MNHFTLHRIDNFLNSQNDITKEQKILIMSFISKLILEEYK